MTIWKNGQFFEDTWIFAGEGDVPAGDVVLGVEALETLAAQDHAGKLGLDVHPGDDMDAIAALLAKVDLVVVNFPAFSDGRAFSLARLIREKYGFEGDIRAKGAFILDQMPMLERCGVTSFDISSEAVATGLRRGDWPDMPRYYQHALDGEGATSRIRAVDPKRPWLSVNVAGENIYERTAA
ncbi:MAG: DUF934 domain-containing protein [Pseudomonadota bacterium]